MGGGWRAGLLIAGMNVALVGCAANPGLRAEVVDDDPQPVSENQQGALVPSTPSFPMTSAPLADAYIWCADVGGLACLRASAALGAQPLKNPANAPAGLYDLEDLPDDCTSTGMMEIRTRIDRALGLASSGWRDQSGNRLDADQFSNIYAAGGCVSDAASPVVKIAATSSMPRRYVVRVWESASGY